MAENTAQIGYGAKVKWSDTSGGTYAPFAELLDLPLPETTFEGVEATHMESPNTKKEKIPGLGEEGDFTFQFNFNKTQYATARGMLGQEKFFKVESPAGDVWGPFPGFLSSMAGDMPIGDRIVAESTIIPQGHIPFTASA